LQTGRNVYQPHRKVYAIAYVIEGKT